MAEDCCDAGCNSNTLLTPKYRKILWVALIINFTMFLVEVLSGFGAHSVSLMADAIDFFGDAMNYSISLAVLSMSLVWRGRAALLKGLTMGVFGLLVLASAAFVQTTILIYKGDKDGEYGWISDIGKFYLLSDLAKYVVHLA